MIWQTSVIPIESPIQNMLFLLSSLLSSNRKESAYLKIEKSNEVFCNPIIHVKWKLYKYHLEKIQRICIAHTQSLLIQVLPYNLEHPACSNCQNKPSYLVWYYFYFHSHWNCFQDCYSFLLLRNVLCVSFHNWVSCHFQSST